MSAKKTTKTTKAKAPRKAAKTTRKATKAALASIESNLEAIDGAAPAGKRKGKGKAAKATKPKKVSALDAAAQVLVAKGEPMNTREMIEAMAAKKLWTSPGGKTPHATLYSAILREINVKGKDARFTKSERGKFTAATAA